MSLIVAWDARSGRRTLAAVVLTLLALGGCGPHGGGPKSEPAPSLGKPATTIDEGEDVLPPQSEPPIVDESTTPDPAATPQQPSRDATPAENDEGTADRSTEAASSPRNVRVLFDGTSLDNWKPSNFGGEGDVELIDGMVVMQRGADLTGIHWAGEPLPKVNYEVTLEAQRIDGSDFFCGIVFPVGESFCSFVAGGWGGSVVGLSSVDDIYAAENETGTYAAFNDQEWYKFRLRVSESAITAWIDGKQYVRLKTKGRKLSLHPAVEPAKPFGVSCYATVAAVRDIQLRELTPQEIAADAAEDDVE
jgi:hypothetical protein